MEMATVATATASDRVTLALAQLIKWVKEMDREEDGGEGDALLVAERCAGGAGPAGDPAALCVAGLSVLVETATPQVSSR